jgi:hypothetical protein
MICKNPGGGKSFFIQISSRLNPLKRRFIFSPHTHAKESHQRHPKASCIYLERLLPAAVGRQSREEWKKKRQDDDEKRFNRYTGLDAARELCSAAAV